MRALAWWALALLCLLAACATAPTAPPADASADHRVYVVRRGWHTDIGLPVSGLDGALAQVAADFPRAGVLLFGFGDRRYLLARQRGLGDVLALWPGEGMMLVTGLEVTPAQAFGTGNAIELPVTAAQARAVADFIAASLRQGADGVPRREGAGPYSGSAFYASALGYSAWHTCNTWTAEALQAGGEPVSSTGVMFTWQLWPQLRQLRPQP